MTIERVMLACSIVLGLVQILLAAHFKTKERGLDWDLGPRDEPEKPLGIIAGRLQIRGRAQISSKPSHSSLLPC